MKRILMVLAGYFPAQKYGGPPVSAQNFIKAMKSEYEIWVVTSDHDKDEQKRLSGISEGWNSVDGANVMYLPDTQMNQEYFEKITEKIKPDWILLNSLFDAKRVLPFLSIANKYQYKVLLAPRGELCAGAFKKKYKKIPYITLLKCSGRLKNVKFQSTSDEETQAIKQYLNAPSENIHYLDNFPSIPEDIVNYSVKEKGKLKIIFFSRIHRKKNLMYCLECLSEINGEVIFDIYGPIEDEAYWNECNEYIKKLPKNVTVCYKGVIAHDDVHHTLQNYNLFFFPTLSENYGHVIAEALYAAVPVLISDATPWTDINEHGGGRAIPLSNKDGFLEYMNEMVEMNQDDFYKLSEIASSYVKNKEDINSLTKKYRSVLT